MQKERQKIGSSRSQHCCLKTHDNGKGLCIKALATEIDQKETASQTA